MMPDLVPQQRVVLVALTCPPQDIFDSHAELLGQHDRRLEVGVCGNHDADVIMSLMRKVNEVGRKVHIDALLAQALGDLPTLWAPARHAFQRVRKDGNVRESLPGRDLLPCGRVRNQVLFSGCDAPVDPNLLDRSVEPRPLLRADDVGDLVRLDLAIRSSTSAAEERSLRALVQVLPVNEDDDTVWHEPLLPTAG